MRRVRRGVVLDGAGQSQTGVLHHVGVDVVDPRAQDGDLTGLDPLVEVLGDGDRQLEAPLGHEPPGLVGVGGHHPEVGADVAAQITDLPLEGGRMGAGALVHQPDIPLVPAEAEQDAAQEHEHERNEHGADEGLPVAGPLAQILVDDGADAVQAPGQPGRRRGRSRGRRHGHCPPVSWV